MMTRRTGDNPEDEKIKYVLDYVHYKAFSQTPLDSDGLIHAILDHVHTKYHSSTKGGTLYVGPKPFSSHPTDCIFIEFRVPDYLQEKVNANYYMKEVTPVVYMSEDLRLSDLCNLENLSGYFDFEKVRNDCIAVRHQINDSYKIAY